MAFRRSRSRCGMNNEKELALMRRAIALSAGTMPHPNPRVGAIVVSEDGKIVAEAAHHEAGGPHAEAAALLQAGEAALGSTLVVTLEPCAHFGRTPPCTDAIVNAGVSRVVVGTLDPDRRVAGNGVAALRSAGIVVVEGVGADAVHANDPSYFHHRSTGRPLVTLKMAMTLDGQAAAADQTARWITGPEARLDGHRLRASSDVVLVGCGTVIADDPRLDVRLDGYAGRQPRPAIVAGRRAVPPDAKLLERNPIVFVPDDDAPVPPGIERVVLPGATGVDLGAALAYLGDHDALDVMIEGGPTLAGASLRAGIVDRVVLYYGAKLAGGVGKPGFDGVFATIGEAFVVDIEKVDVLDGDVRVEGIVRPVGR